MNNSSGDQADQCFFFSWSIGLLTLTIIYFHYLNEYFLDQSIPKTVYFIWKTEALKLKYQNIKKAPFCFALYSRFLFQFLYLSWTAAHTVLLHQGLWMRFNQFVIIGFPEDRFLFLCICMFFLRSYRIHMDVGISKRYLDIQAFVGNAQGNQSYML